MSGHGVYYSRKSFLSAELRICTTFEDVYVIFCDEISMVGSAKLQKINFRLQDLADGTMKHEYMGGKSFIASGTSSFIVIILSVLI